MTRARVSVCTAVRSAAPSSGPPPWHMSSRTTVRTAVLAALVVLVAACGGVTSAPRATNPTEAAFARAQRGAERAAARARADTDATAPMWVAARRNPAPCACPDWEVHAWGRWRRVDLVAGAGISLPAALVPSSDAGSEAPPTARVRVEVRGRVAGGPSGWNYPVLEVLDAAEGE